MTISYQEEIKFISNKIRELRKEKQMTVQELAYRSDMERTNIIFRTDPTQPTTRGEPSGAVS